METTPPAEIEPPANVLVVQSLRNGSTDCHGLYHETGTATLTITFDDTQIEQPFPVTDETLGFLVIGDVLSESENGFETVSPIMTESIADPTDLAAIGVAVSRFCKHWDEEAALTVCFDSLDNLLRHTAPKTVFQFTHVLLNRLAGVDAYAHFHFDPTHHDDRVASTFGTIFDAVVTDDTTRNSLPQATDDEVAALLSEWDEDSIDDELASSSVTEATDEEIANLLGE